ncbi:MAG: amidohydrolase family protein [Pelagibacteraceae bacterium]|jgi:imidazolonepropionase-like amidohydrolase|nr:amidohydrolase family protein [Pelagibacteraceae bacterium]MBT6355301.1 amidohydrolase family protein [Pelagibacteraceae bacterium]
MPEAPAWKFKKILRPLFEKNKENILFKLRVINPKTLEVIENGFVEIDDGVITKVGKQSDLGDNLNVQKIIELKDHTILPGLMNSHAHLAWDGTHDLAQQSMDDPVEISAYKSSANMLKSLRAGVTLVRDLGMNKSNLFAKQAIEQGIYPGPRLKVCGEAIVQTAGHTYWCCREASGADEMRRAVRDQVGGGADLIKIMACHDTLEFTDDELSAVIDETHRNGLYITAHATYDDAISRVTDFGIDCIEHGGPMSDSTIEKVAKKNIPICTTFSPVVMQSNAELARKYNIPEWKIEERQKIVNDKSRFDSLVKASEAGIEIIFGTDAGSPVVPHDAIVPEMKFMIDLGVVKNNLEAIQSATYRAAKVNKVEDKVGSIEVGKEADLIIVEGSPDKNIEDLTKVQQVYINGNRLI